MFSCTLAVQSKFCYLLPHWLREDPIMICYLYSHWPIWKIWKSGCWIFTRPGKTLELLYEATLRFKDILEYPSWPCPAQNDVTLPSCCVFPDFFIWLRRLFIEFIEGFQRLELQSKMHIFQSIQRSSFFGHSHKKKKHMKLCFS